MKEERKKLLHVPISWPIYKDLNAYILQKQGYIKKGDLSKYVEIGIKSIILSGNTQQQYTKNVQKAENQILKVRVKWQLVSQYLIDTDGFELREGIICPHKLLDKAISAKLGHDPRTRRNWIQDFINNGFIKSANQFNNAYVVLTTPEFILPQFNKEELR
jgi:hypothetical protein